MLGVRLPTTVSAPASAHSQGLRTADASPLGRASHSIGPRLVLLLVACLAGGIVGLASAILPYWFVISVIVLPLFALVLFLRPEYAIVACIGLACGLIHPRFVPHLPVLGGALGAADLAIALLAAYATVVALARPADRSARNQTPGKGLWILLLLFLAMFVAAIAISITLKGIPTKDVLGEGRDLAYLVLVPIAAVILNEPVRQRRFVFGLIVLGLLFSIGQVLQGAFDIPVFGQSGRLEVLETLGHAEAGATRSLTRGISVIIMALFLVVGFFVLGQMHLVAFLGASALLLAGIFLTFGRTTFAVVALGVLILVVALRASRLPTLMGIFALALVLSAAGLAAFKPKVVEGFIQRVTSVNTELRSGYSAQWRYEEARFMMPRILEHPLEGLGLGAEYKGSGGSMTNPELNRYVHNAYLYMGGKMGLPALVVFLLFTVAVFRLGWGLRKEQLDPWRRVVGVTCAVMMIRFWLASLTEPHFMSDYSLAVVAACAALAWLAARGADQPPATPHAAPDAAARGAAIERRAPRRATHAD